MGKKKHIKGKTEVFEIMKEQKVDIYIRKNQGYKVKHKARKKDETSSDFKYTSQKCSFFSSETHQYKTFGHFW